MGKKNKFERHLDKLWQAALKSHNYSGIEGLRMKIQEYYDWKNKQEVSKKIRSML